MRANRNIDLTEHVEVWSEKTRSIPPSKLNPFLDIKKRFLYAKEHNIPIILENSGLNNSQSVVLDLSFVGDKWAMGYVTYYSAIRTESTPYTIHYSDLYCAGKQSKKNKRVKVIFKGDNPYTMEEA